MSSDKTPRPQAPPYFQPSPPQNPPATNQGPSCSSDERGFLVSTDLNPSSPPSPSSSSSFMVNRELCRTPSSDDHKIPTARSCPPTPRKPTGGASAVPWNSHKRKLPDQIRFFESTNREELDSFFQDCHEQCHTSKKRCTSIWLFYRPLCGNANSPN